MSRWYEVEYRETPFDTASEIGWRRVTHRFAQDVSAIDLGGDGLDAGRSYDVRIRMVDDAGPAGVWRTYTGIVAAAPEATPPETANLRLVDHGCLAWDQPRGHVALRGWEVRHAVGAHETWGTAEAAHPGIVERPPFGLCAVPKGDRTILARTVDWDGNRGDVTTLRTYRGSLDDAEEFTLRTIDEEALGWPGLLQGGTIAGDRINADPSAGSPEASAAWLADLEPAWSVADGVPAWSGQDEPAWGGTWGDRTPWWCLAPTEARWATPNRWIEYVWTVEVHHGEHGPDVVLTVDVETTGTAWRLSYRRRWPTPAWDENPRTPAWTSASDPYWATPAVAFQPWPGRLEGVPAGRYDLRLLVPGGMAAGVTVTRILTRISARRREVLVTEISAPAGTTRAAPPAPFRQLLRAAPQYVGAEPGARGLVRALNRTKGPEVGAEVGTEAVAGALDVVLVGHGQTE